MSQRVNGVIVIAAEKDLICFECGKVAETRPYGRNGAEICHECGMKDERSMLVEMHKRLFGDTQEEAEKHADSQLRNQK